MKKYFAMILALALVLSLRRQNRRACKQFSH